LEDPQDAHRNFAQLLMSALPNSTKAL
jgi:hypothetical protein